MRVVSLRIDCFFEKGLEDWNQVVEAGSQPRIAIPASSDQLAPPLRARLWYLRSAAIHHARGDIKQLLRQMKRGEMLI